VTGHTTWYTLHLYLNDSLQAFSTDKEKAAIKPRDFDAEFGPLKGGSTPFICERRERARDTLKGKDGIIEGDRKVDVHPKAGRVLIFQHLELLHSGAIVEAGVKYTMRSDVVYKKVDL
jgi:hypothetical protein